MKIQNQGFDHVEYILTDITSQARIFERMGFEKLGERRSEKYRTRSVLYGQGLIRVILTQPEGIACADHLGVQFLQAQGEGICVLAVDVDDAEAAYHETTDRGARSAMAPARYESPDGSVTVAEIYTPGLVRYRFVSRKAPNGPTKPALFLDDLTATRLESPSPLGLRVIDHLTNNVDMGEMKKWVKWYKDVFGFIVTRHFDISTGRTGLTSDVVESTCRKIKVPINEATEPESQVQEFVRRLKGPGVQHLALLTTGIQGTLKSLRKESFKFLTVPHTYYEAVPTRVPGVKDDLRELEELGILLDGDQSGYLLQIFSEEVLGPFFFEYIERKGNQGFGEGNFKALFEAIERDQVRRGVL